MARLFLFAAVVVVPLVSGCASTWDTATSRGFREKPFGTMFDREDPLHTLRTVPNENGTERARAMLKLKEPTSNGQDQAVQEEVMQMLSTAATSDPSPWVRVCAIDTLAKFKDPRTPEILANAYHHATGKPREPNAPPAANPIQQASGGREPGRYAVDRLGGLTGPQGFPADQVANIRSRAVEGLGKTQRPEAVEFLTRVANGQEFGTNEDPTTKDYVRQRAVASLGQMRQKEAVVALNKVLTTESGKDVALASLAHNGLKSLTGKNIPADPEKWNGVIQTGFEIAPEPSMIQRAVATVVD